MARNLGQEHSARLARLAYSGPYNPTRLALAHGMNARGQAEQQRQNDIGQQQMALDNMRFQAAQFLAEQRRRRKAEEDARNPLKGALKGAVTALPGAAIMAGTGNWAGAGAMLGGGAVMGATGAAVDGNAVGYAQPMNQAAMLWGMSQIGRQPVPQNGVPAAAASAQQQAATGIATRGLSGGSPQAAMPGALPAQTMMRQYGLRLMGRLIPC
jgi:hypothetical protein